MDQMKIVIQKYGGTSVESTDKIISVSKRIRQYIENQYSVVVVVSAMGNSTNTLVKLAYEISNNPSKREMDMLLSTGEQISISLLALALHEIGIDAISYTGSQVKVITDDNFSNAKIQSISTDKILNSLKQNKVVIVAGFQGIDMQDNITTLGRGGSDTSAVALAAVLGARECEIYTDVDGIYTADPRITKNTKKLKEISYEEMLELSRLGAKVLHSRAVEFAKKYNIILHVRSSFSYDEGTLVMNRKEIMEKFVIRGVTSKLDEAKVTIRDIPDKPGIASKLFNKLGKNKIYVNMIVQSTGHDGIASISFTILKKDLQDTLKYCEELKTEFKASNIDYKNDIAIVSAIGVGMLSSYGVAGRMFNVLSKNNINIEMISTSEIGISCVIESHHAELATTLIHNEFID